MMKVRSVVLASLASFVLLLAPRSAHAQFGYGLNLLGLSVSVNSYSGPGGAVTVPSVLIALPVTTIAKGTFSGNSSITSVTVPGSVTSIAADAFDNCPNLTSIIFLGDAPSAATGAFQSDTNATIYYVPGTKSWKSTLGGLPVVSEALSVALSSPTNGQTFAGALTVPLAATLTTQMPDCSVSFYNGSALLGTVSSAPYNIAANLSPGTYALYAVAKSAVGVSATSAVSYVTVNSPGDILIDFDSLDTSGGAAVTGQSVVKYLAQFGVTVGGLTPSTKLEVDNQASVLGLEAVNAPSAPNILTQTGALGPVSFTVNFNSPLSQFSFTRPGLIAAPTVSHPAWRARAFDALGIELGEASEGQIVSLVNVPAAIFTLGGGSIASVEFDSLGTGLTTFNSLLLDNFVLTPGVTTNLPPSVIVTSPAAGTVIDSDNTFLGVQTAPGAGVVSSVAYFLNGLLLTNTAYPFFSSLNAPSNGLYYVTAVAVNTAGLISTSAPVPLTVAFGFAFLTQPFDQTIGVGGSATFSVLTTALNPSYQWLYDNSAIAGATNAVYSISNALQSESGSYSVTVTSGETTLNSSAANLTVLAPPQLGSISAATNGSDVVLTVSAVDVVPFYAKWQLNGNSVASSKTQFDAGATNATYTIKNAKAFDSGYYSVVAANAVASTQSSNYDLIVNEATAVVSTNNTFDSSFDLDSLTNGVGAMGSNVVARGTAAGPGFIAGKKAGGYLWYDWTADFTGVIALTTRGSTFDTLLGVYTGDSLTNLTSIAEDDDSGGFFTSLVSFNCVQGTNYHIVVAGYHGATGMVSLSMSPGQLLGLAGPTNGYSVGAAEPVITAQPSNEVVQAGSTVVLNASETNGINCQWYFEGAPVAGGTNVNLVISNFPASAAGNYYLQISNAVDVVQSEPAQIQVAAVAAQGAQANVLMDKFGDAVDLAGIGTDHYRPKDGGGDSGGYTVSQSFNTTGATKETGEPNHAGQPGGASYWYTYTAKANGTLEFDTQGSSFNTILAIYIGPGDSFSTLTNVGAEYTTNYIIDGQPSVVISNVVAGTPYYIAVDGYGDASGAAQLNINANDPGINKVNTNTPPATNSEITVAITSPTANYLTTNAFINLSGTIASHAPSLSVTAVLVSVNGNPPAPALVGVGNPPTSWSLAGVPLIAGANSISAQCFSIDTNNVQNVSPPAVTTIFYSAAMPVVDATAPLTVLTNGSGSVTGLASLSALELNQVYSVQAVPSGTWAFSNWSMGPDANDLAPVSDSATFSFLMTSNLVIQANFVTNPFPATAGVYHGLFFPSNGVAEASSGFLTATITRGNRGAYSAKILLDGGAYGFGGVFNHLGDAGATVRRPGKTPVNVSLHLNFGAGDNQLTGSVTECVSNGWVAQLAADRAVFNARSNPAKNYAGKYTLVVPPGANAPAIQPGGYGYASVRGNLSGQVVIHGQLSDGSPFTQSVPVSESGNVPFYSSLYARKGSLMGWLTLTNVFDSTPQKTIAGSGLSWIKESGRAGTMYCGGFTNTDITIFGSAYTPPPAGSGIVLTNGAITLSDGNLSGPLVYTNLARLDARPPAGAPEPHLAPATGVLTVVFPPDESGHSTVAHGVVLQNGASTAAAGWFLGTNYSGSFLFQP
jgi:hypothetical protein